MGALEHVLEQNPAPLLEFSALRDFSGENIAFLTSVAAWRAAFLPAPPSCGKRSITLDFDASETRSMTGTTSQNDLTRDFMRGQFNRALKIYVNFISYRHAIFQVNLPSRVLKDLEAIFETPAQDLFGVGRETDPVTPFAAAAELRRASDGSGASCSEAPESCGESKKSAIESHSGQMVTPASSSASTFRDGIRLRYAGEIPASFNEAIFDDAEASVKYLVLTNTWPKFVKERRTSVDSELIV